MLLMAGLEDSNKRQPLASVNCIHPHNIWICMYWTERTILEESFCSLRTNAIKESSHRALEIAW
jgi:hypothetical protein